MDQNNKHGDSGNWIKAEDSKPNGNCVEMQPREDGVAVRDSKNPHAQPLSFTKAEFSAWLDGAKKGEFDHLL